MNLYIMRHGQAAPTAQNAEQELTRQGRTGIEKLAAHLDQQGVKVKHVYHSGKARARQTAEIMASELAANVKLQVHDHIKPDDDPQQLLQDIQAWHEDTLVVSHLPFIPSLVSRLTADAMASLAIAYTPGTIICLMPENNAWQIAWVEAPAS